MKKFFSVVLIIAFVVGVYLWLVKLPTVKKWNHKAVIISLPDSANPYFHKLDTFFTNRSLQNGFSGSVLISKNGNCVYNKCFGYCDYRSKNLMSDTNSFQLASVSKTFTATAVLWCAEHDMLSLDDELQKFLPFFPYAQVRIKDLLSHRSGLPNYLYFCSRKCNRGEYLNNEQVLNIMQTEKPAPYALPNRKFEYCNTNYMLLAMVVEKVSGKKFSVFMHETFFEPLEMERTFIYNHEDSLSGKIAVSYNSKWEIQKDDCFDGVVGDKGVYSTVSDMFKWDKAFYDGKLLSQEMMREAYAPRSFEHPGKRNYGYGWRLLEQPDGNYLVYHNGWWHGNNTVFYRYIQDTTAVIILSNRYNKWVYGVQPVFNILYGGKGGDSGFWEE